MQSTRSKHHTCVHGLVALALAAALACVSSPPPTRTLVLTISNQLGRPIAEIRSKGCGDLELALTEIENSRFAVGETRGIALPPSCVDLVAFDGRRRIVGEQRELRMLPGARWVLQR